MDQNTMTELWADFVFNDRMDERVPTPIAESWRKCKAAGVNPAGGEGRHIDEKVLASVRAANKTFIDIAVPIMQSVFEIVRKTHFLIVLTDSAGYLMEMLGDDDIISRCNDMRFIPGALWSNIEVGTNAISIALDYDMPIQTVGSDHYCRTHHSWTCSAAPIHGLNGEIIGCINMSGDADFVSEHTLGLVLAAAYGIEGQIKVTHNARLMQSALESSADSIILLDEDYHAFWMNSSARQLLEMGNEELSRMDFRELLPGVDWQKKIWSVGERYFSDDQTLVVNGSTKYCTSVISPLTEYGIKTLSVTLRKQKHLIKAVNKMSGNRAIFSFNDFYTTDDKLKKVLALASKFANYGGNILIEGESGTGKEVLAQAIHNAGPNAAGPFVAVSCASIPRDMFEMELFGYEAGAFPGKVAEGSPGRFELAQHGTLFLDEISEMPLEFQSKLLRAVETHSVLRLGGAQEIALDIRIIASTGQRLDRLVETGGFRRELYYRLNVLKLEISPLRSRRQDIAYCAERFMEKFNSSSPDMKKSMSPEFLAGLEEYDWPGNTRQLQNSLARAFYASPGEVLSTESLSYAIERPPETEKTEKAARNTEGYEGTIMAALTLCAGDVEKAAEKLDISRATLYRKMKKYGINPKGIKIK